MIMCFSSSCFRSTLRVKNALSLLMVPGFCEMIESADAAADGLPSVPDFSEALTP